MSEAPCVFIVDDEAPVRDSLAFLIQSADLAAETFASAEDFLSYYEPYRAGCILLDIKLRSGMSGLELQQELRRREASTPVIVMTAYGDVPTSVQAMKSGAFDFLEKPFADQTLLSRVCAAIEHDAELRTLETARREARRRLSCLTPREREVMELVVSGKANKIIADILEIREKTVEVHRGHVMSKTGAGSLAELVTLAMTAARPTLV